MEAPTVNKLIPGLFSIMRQIMVLCPDDGPAIIYGNTFKAVYGYHPESPPPTSVSERASPSSQQLLREASCAQPYPATFHTAHPPSTAEDAKDTEQILSTPSPQSGAKVLHAEKPPQTLRKLRSAATTPRSNRIIKKKAPESTPGRVSSSAASKRKHPT